MPATATGPAMLSVSALCERLSCSRATAYRLIRLGALKATKNPGRNGAIRVSETDLAEYLAAYTVAAASPELLRASLASTEGDD